jgi:pimeloyl-ACP methyl ester carboxylesterase
MVRTNRWTAERRQTSILSPLRRLEASRLSVPGARSAPRKDSQPAKSSAFHGIARAGALGCLAGVTIAAIAVVVLWVPLSARSAPQAPPPDRETSADLPGVRLWYRDTGGNGVPVVFLHAATGSSRVWEYQIPAFTKEGFRVIAYDRRGFGRTVIDPAGAQPGTGADDLQALVTHLRIDRFHLVSTAAGGFVAFDYALSFPQRLRSLVVANSLGGVQDEEFLAMGRRVRPAPQFNALPPEFRELGPSYRVANPQGTGRWVELEHASRAEGPQPPAQTMRNQVTFAALEGIRVPTLLLTGDADLFVPPPVLRLFAARIKNAQSVIVPEAGHSSYWERPEIFNRAVLSFIRKH